MKLILEARKSSEKKEKKSLDKEKEKPITLKTKRQG